MANRDRKIIRGVRVKNMTYVSGKEDELNAVLSSAEVSRLKEKGYIQGEWSGVEAAVPVVVTAVKELEPGPKPEPESLEPEPEVLSRGKISAKRGK